jgi:hypothetical protein
MGVRWLASGVSRSGRAGDRPSWRSRRRQELDVRLRRGCGVPRPGATAGRRLLRLEHGRSRGLAGGSQVQPHSVVLLESSPPGETQGFDPDVRPAHGLFDPEELYGAFPQGIRSRPESARARADRKRGISVPSLPAPALVVVGREFPERGRPLADLYCADLVEFPELDHWELVLSPHTRQIVREWLERKSRAYG